MADRKHVKPATVEVLRVLDNYWPGFVTVPHLIEKTRQVDVRKRISEAIRAGFQVEKARDGRFVSYRWSA